MTLDALTFPAPLVAAASIDFAEAYRESCEERVQDDFRAFENALLRRTWHAPRSGYAGYSYPAWQLCLASYFLDSMRITAEREQHDPNALLAFAHSRIGGWRITRDFHELYAREVSRKPSLKGAYDLVTGDFDEIVELFSRSSFLEQAVEYYHQARRDAGQKQVFDIQKGYQIWQ